MYFVLRLIEVYLQTGVEVERLPHANHNLTVSYVQEEKIRQLLCSAERARRT